MKYCSFYGAEHFYGMIYGDKTKIMLISFCGGITAKEFGNHVGGSNSTNFTFCSWLIQQHDWKNIKPQSSYAKTDILLYLFRQALQSAHTSRHFTDFLCLAFKLTQQRTKLRRLNRWPWINKTICGWMETQHTDVKCLPSCCQQAAFFYTSHGTQDYITLDKFSCMTSIHQHFPLLITFFCSVPLQLDNLSILSQYNQFT